MNEFTTEESQAIYKSIQYWIDKWDWECPTLFGLEKFDMEAVVNRWPNALKENREIALKASLGSLGELLYGASAVPKSKISEILGMSYDQSEELCGVIRSECVNGL